MSIPWVSKFHADSPKLFKPWERRHFLYGGNNSSIRRMPIESQSGFDAQSFMAVQSERAFDRCWHEPPCGTLVIPRQVYVNRWEPISDVVHIGDVLWHSLLIPRGTWTIRLALMPDRDPNSSQLNLLHGIDEKRQEWIVAALALDRNELTIHRNSHGDAPQLKVHRLEGE